MDSDLLFRGLSLRNCRGAFMVLALAAPLAASAATIWSGPMITFTEPDNANPAQADNQDRLTSLVWLTRGDLQGLYNAESETSFTHFLSPAGTAWANGTTANYSTLSYTDWNTWAKGVNPSPPSTIGVNAVLHLISEDIYLDIQFTSWSVRNSGFSYQRSTPGVPEPSAGLLLLAGLATAAARGYRR
jgi:hypothetical protein